LAAPEFIGHHLAGVGGGLRRVILPGGGGAVVQGQDAQLVAGDPALLVDAVHGALHAVAHEVRGIRLRPGQRQVETDGDGFVLCASAADEGRGECRA
jgi:hypothetical protein